MHKHPISTDCRKIRYLFSVSLNTALNTCTGHLYDVFNSLMDIAIPLLLSVLAASVLHVLGGLPRHHSNFLLVVLQGIVASALGKVMMDISDMSNHRKLWEQVKELTSNWPTDICSAHAPYKSRTTPICFLSKVLQTLWPIPQTPSRLPRCANGVHPLCNSFQPPMWNPSAFLERRQRPSKSILLLFVPAIGFLDSASSFNDRHNEILVHVTRTRFRDDVQCLGWHCLQGIQRT